MAVQWAPPILAATTPAISLGLQPLAGPYPSALYIIGPSPNGDQAYNFQHRKQPQALQTLRLASSRDPFFIELALNAVEQQNKHHGAQTRRRNKRRYKRASALMEPNTSPAKEGTTLSVASNNEEDKKDRAGVVANDVSGVSSGELAVSKEALSIQNKQREKFASLQPYQPNADNQLMMLQRDQYELDYEGPQSAYQQPQLPGTRRYNRPRNKKPVYVSINQQTVNGLLSLLLLFSVSICGTVGTIFIISALTVIESLQTRGNCYLVSLALAHLLVTLLVIPTSALQIMAGDGIDGRLLCHYQWLTLEFSLIVSQLSFLLMAADNYLGYKSTEKVTTIDNDDSHSLQQLDENSTLVTTTTNSRGRIRPPIELAQILPSGGKQQSRSLPGDYTSRLPRILSLIIGCCFGPSGKSPREQSADTNIKQKLSLAHQFSNMKGATLEKPGCFSYRNCCGRLKVLFWILSVWLVASVCTFRRHELRYGANFCPGNTPAHQSTKPQPYQAANVANVSLPSQVVHHPANQLLANHDEMASRKSSLAAPTSKRSTGTSAASAADRAGESNIRHPSGNNQPNRVLKQTYPSDEGEQIQRHRRGIDDRFDKLLNQTTTTTKDLRNTQTEVGRRTNAGEWADYSTANGNRRAKRPVNGGVHRDGSSADNIYRKHLEGDPVAVRAKGMNLTKCRTDRLKGSGSEMKDGCFDKGSEAHELNRRDQIGADCVGGSVTDEVSKPNNNNDGVAITGLRVNSRLQQQQQTGKLGPLDSKSGPERGLVKFNNGVGRLMAGGGNIAGGSGEILDFSPRKSEILSRGLRINGQEPNGQQKLSEHLSQTDQLFARREDKNAQHGDNNEMGTATASKWLHLAGLTGTDSKARYDGSYHRNRRANKGERAAEGSSRPDKRWRSPCKAAPNWLGGKNDNDAQRVVGGGVEVNRIKADQLNGSDKVQIAGIGRAKWFGSVEMIQHPPDASGAPILSSGQLVNGPNDNHHGGQNNSDKSPDQQRNPRHENGDEKDVEGADNHRRSSESFDKLGQVPTLWHNYGVGANNNNTGQQDYNRLSSFPSNLFHHDRHIIHRMSRQTRPPTRQHMQSISQNLPGENLRSHYRSGGSQLAPLSEAVASKNLMNNDNHNGSNNNEIAAKIVAKQTPSSPRAVIGSNSIAGGTTLLQATNLNAVVAAKSQRVAGTSGPKRETTDPTSTDSSDIVGDKILPSDGHGEESIEANQNDLGHHGLRGDHVVMLLAGDPSTTSILVDGHLSDSSEKGEKVQNLQQGKKEQLKHYWLVLICTILVPSLISAILFLGAWLKMKIFKMRPYKPMPVSALNSAMSSLLVSPISPLPVIPQHQVYVFPDTRAKGKPIDELANSTNKHCQSVGRRSPLDLANGRDKATEQGSENFLETEQQRFGQPERLKFGWPKGRDSISASGQLLDAVEGSHNRRSISQPSGVTGGSRAMSSEDMIGKHPSVGEPNDTIEPSGTTRANSATLMPSNWSPQSTHPASQVAAPPPTPMKLPPMSPPNAPKRQQVNQVMSAPPIGYGHYVQHHQPQQQQQPQQQLQHNYHCIGPTSNLAGSEAHGLCLSPYQGAGQLPANNRLPTPIQFNETVTVMRETFSSPSSATFRRELDDDLFGPRPAAAANATPPTGQACPVSGSQEAINSVYLRRGSEYHTGSSHQQHYGHHNNAPANQPASIRRLSPIEQSDHQYFEFRRRQIHAQSFHYGSSSMRHHRDSSSSNNNNHHHQLATGSQQSSAPPPEAYEFGSIVVSADRIDAASYGEFQYPSKAFATTTAATTAIAATSDEKHQQHLLERHRSLPRSSRLYNSDKKARQHSVNGGTDTSAPVADCTTDLAGHVDKVAAGGSGSFSGPAAALSRQMRCNRKQQQQQRASIGGQIYEIGAEFGGQVMDGRPAMIGERKAQGSGELLAAGSMSKALANIIKSMDSSSPTTKTTTPLALESSRDTTTGAIGNFKVATQWDEDDDVDDGEHAKYGPELNGTFEIRQAGGLSYQAHRALDGNGGEKSRKANEFVNRATGDHGKSANKSSSNSAANTSEKVNSRAILCTYSHMTDDQLLQSNIIVFIVNLTLWLPFILLSIVAQYRDQLTQELKDSVWWLATLNCCSCSYVYAITNKDFREAFNKLFYYCCCKSHVTFQKKTPIFRRQLDLDSKGNLRIHIIPGLNVYSNKLSKNGGDQNPLTLGSSSCGGGGGFGSLQTPLGGSLGGHHQASGAHGSATHEGPASIGSNSATHHRHHHMSVGGGFGGPLFASSKLYSGSAAADAGSAGGRTYGRYHSSLSHDRKSQPIGEL